MFGYLVANLDALDGGQREQYQAWYCGLCRTLGARHGWRGRLCIAFDLVFLALVLDAFGEEPPGFSSFVCPARPLKRRPCLKSGRMAYAADMNVLLAYWQRLDRWRDDRSFLGLLQARALRPAARRAEAAFPAQAEAIEAGLCELHRLEEQGELNPDKPAAAFGRVAAALFSPPPPWDGPDLQPFGVALGRFIYLMDAAVDLRRDLKKLRYNPLAAFPAGRREELLTLSMALCAERFEALGIGRNRELLENILYSGVWTRWNAAKKGGARGRPL